jgi:hypothetical protein
MTRGNGTFSRTFQKLTVFIVANLLAALLLALN